MPAVVALYADDLLGQERERVVDPLPASYWTAFEAIRTDPRHRLVVIDDGEIAATLQLSFLPHLVRAGSERARIGRCASRSHPSWRRAGAALLGWAIQEARQRGCGVVQLTTDATRPDAHRTYQALGFAATHVGMKLTLDQAGH